MSSRRRGACRCAVGAFATLAAIAGIDAAAAQQTARYEDVFLVTATYSLTLHNQVDRSFWLDAGNSRPLVARLLRERESP